MTAKITLNKRSNALFLIVRIPLVVSSATTTPITFSSTQIGCAAESTTALLSGVRYQDEPTSPIIASSTCDPNSSVASSNSSTKSWGGRVSNW